MNFKAIMPRKFIKNPERDLHMSPLLERIIYVEPTFSRGIPERSPYFLLYIPY